MAGTTVAVGTAAIAVRGMITFEGMGVLIDQRGVMALVCRRLVSRRVVHERFAHEMAITGRRIVNRRGLRDGL